MTSSERDVKVRPTPEVPKLYSIDELLSAIETRQARVESSLRELRRQPLRNPDGSEPKNEAEEQAAIRELREQAELRATHEAWSGVRSGSSYPEPVETKHRREARRLEALGPPVHSQVQQPSEPPVRTGLPSQDEVAFLPEELPPIRADGKLTIELKLECGHTFHREVDLMVPDISDFGSAFKYLSLVRELQGHDCRVLAPASDRDRPSP